MDAFHKVKFEVWIDGYIEWVPYARYLGGSRHAFPDIYLDEIFYHDFIDMYEKASGKKDANISVYYLQPGARLDEGLKPIVDDDGVRTLQNEHKSLHVVTLFIEERVLPLHNANPTTDEANEVDEGVTGDQLQREQLPSLGDPEDEESDGSQSDKDSDNDVDNFSWLAEDFEGPGDDDIFVERPADHSEQEMRKMKNAKRKEAEKEKQRKECLYEEQELNLAEWYTDNESESDLEDSPDSNDNGHTYEIWREKNYPDMSRFEMKVGMQFPTRAIYREVLRDWLVRKGWDIKFLKNEKSIITAVCKKECPWKIHASTVMKTTTFQVKSIKGSHRCAFETYNKQATYKYIGGRIINYVRDNPEEKLEVLNRKIWRDIQVNCSLNVVYRAKRYALKLIKGSVSEEYERLWDYCGAVCNENIDSTLEMKLDRSVDPPALERMYFGLGCLKAGFLAGCRPMIGLDACFLKGPYKGQLLAAVGRDGNDNLYPIAMAVVEVEKYDTWLWFLEILLRDIGSQEDKGWAFISDRQKGLIEAVAELAPHAEHRFCLRHMYNNFRAKFRGLDMHLQFWGAALTANKQVHLRIMKEINAAYPQTKENEVTPYVWLRRINPHHWARAYFPTTSKCNISVNNMSESFNSYIMEARDLPIISMWEWIRSKLMSRIQVKRMGMMSYDKVVCPNILKKIEKQRVYSRPCYPSWAGEDKFEVIHGNSNHVVKLNSKQCTCGMFHLSCYPCCHALSAILYHRLEVDDYVDECFKKDKYLLTYDHMIHPVPGMKFFLDSGKGPVAPPRVRITGGRPQKKRRRDENDKCKPNIASRRGLTTTCSNCLEHGHNKRSCKNLTHNKSKFFKDRESAEARMDEAEHEEAHGDANADNVEAPSFEEPDIEIPAQSSLRQSTQTSYVGASNFEELAIEIPRQPSPLQPNLQAPRSNIFVVPPPLRQTTENYELPLRTENFEGSSMDSFVDQQANDALTKKPRHKKLTVAQVVQRIKERKGGDPSL